MGEQGGNGFPRNFTFSQVVQVLTILAAGLLGWANLRGDVREGFARIEGQIAVMDSRVSSLERSRDRGEQRQGRLLDERRSRVPKDEP